MVWKHRFAKLTSILLIGMGVYQIVYSAILLVFVYPHLRFGTGRFGLLLYEGLIEKIIVYYISMVISGIYGLVLLFKPKEELTYIQILGGLIIFGLTIFFVTRTPVTTDPILELLRKLIKR